MHHFRTTSFRFMVLLIALALLLPVATQAQTTDPLTRDVDSLLASQDPVWVHLDGALLNFQIPPVIVEGSTYVELNTLFTNLGITGMMLQMVSSGEESGELEVMLDKVADFYEREVDDAVDAMASIIEPFMIVILGTIIGTMVLAMYLPIFKLASVF